MLVLQQGVKVCDWLVLPFDSPDKRIQAAESIQFLAIAELCLVQPSPQYAQRFIVSFERHRKRVPVFSSKSEREAGGIRKPGRRTMYHFSNQSQGLQRPGPDLFQKQQRGKIAQLPVVADCKNRAEPLQIHVFSAHVMMLRQGELPHLGNGLYRVLPRNL